MNGRTSWRKRLAAILGLALAALALFALTGTESKAGLSLMDRVRHGVRGGLRAIGASAPQPGGAVIKRESGRAIAMREQQLARDLSLIRMRGHDFHPQTDSPVPSDVPQELLAPLTPLAPESELGAAIDRRYEIVQYEGRAPAFTDGVATTGADVVDIVPNRAFVVRGTPQQIDRVLDLPMVTWHGEYLPAYRLAQDVKDLLELGIDTTRLPIDDRGLVRLQVDFFRGSSAVAYTNDIKRIPGVVVPAIVDQEENTPVAKVFVTPDALRNAVIQLAKFRDVSAIVDDQMPVPHNDQSAWYVQTGIDQPGANGPTGFDVSAKLFRKGITGRGMLGADADDGLENDLCHFRYGADPNQAGWPLGTDALNQALWPVEAGVLPDAPAPAPVRTRLRKVVAYYVMGAAAAYSSDIQHGTSTASCMLGDAFSVLAARPLVRDLGRDQFVQLHQAGGTWSWGDSLRDDLISRVDDPDSDVDFPSNPPTYASFIDHHQAVDGTAPGAQLVFQDIGNAAGDLSGVYTGYSLIHQAEFTGATVHNDSFGSPECTQCYAGNASGGDDASWRLRDIQIFSSAGNNGAVGTGSIGGGFAHGKNTVTAGATERGSAASTGTARPGENIASFSGRGPKSGGLLAPDLVAPGIVVAATENSVAPEDGSGSGNPGCGPPPGQINGTSFSCPTLAGEALLVQQYFWDGFYPSGRANSADALRPTNALVRAVMTNSARNLKGIRTGDQPGGGQGDRPNFGQGWGAPRLDDSLYFSGDPTNDDPRGDTERARLLVFTDTPNGLIDGETAAGRLNCNVGRTQTALSPEPGGRTREEIVQRFQRALQDANTHDFFLNVINPAPADAANELRITMAYADAVGPTGVAVVTVNDLDLEVVSPSGRIYRTNPFSAWTGGYTQPSPDNREQTNPPTIDFADRDALDTVENVFIPSTEVEAGQYHIKVIGWNVPGNGNNVGDARPNYIDGDRPCAYDADGDGTLDLDYQDRVESNRQGYALVVSGNFTTTQGLVALNRSSFGCSGESLIVTVNDENGDVDRTRCDPDGDGTGLDAQVSVEIKTTTPSIAFPFDREIVDLSGSQPSYVSSPIPVVVTDNPLDVIHGDGVIEIARGQTFTVTYLDGDPCGGESFAQAGVGCTPSISDSGFLIEDGCDQPRSDSYMDAGELVRYTAFFVNNGADALNDARLTLTPDPLNPVSALITVLNTPQIVGLAPPGRRSDATFLVQLGSPIPSRTQVDFEICLTSPADGLIYPTCYTQTQILEADIESFRYDTRDPAGDLFAPGRIERSAPGAPNPPVLPGDFVDHAPMWFDPDADCDPGAGFVPCSTVCNVGRETWPAGGTLPPAGPCQDPAIRTGNSFNPWDFDDANDGFAMAVYEGDANRIQDFYWKTGSNGGGGCGWENELNNQLTSLPANHPDKIAQPWGIWHTGQINRTSGPGPFPPGTSNQGAPFYDQGDDTDPNWHTIKWDSSPAGANNVTGQWCDSYVSNPPTHSQFYRYFLVPPRLYRVHRTNPDFKVEFEELRFYTRLDGHTIDGDNVAVAGWYVNNEPVDPIAAAPPSYSWSQYKYGTLIFTDGVVDDWSTDDSFIDVNLRSTNSDFPGLSFEDIYGPAQDSWNFTFTWAHFNFQGGRSRGQYGWGLDDVEFQWTESRDVADLNDCAVTPQRPTVYFDSTRYNSCKGTAHITVIDTTQSASQIAVCVTAAAEDHEVTVLIRTSPGHYEGDLLFSVDPADDVVGTLLVSAGGIDIGSAADTMRVEYDPGNSSDWDPSDPAFGAEESCDWRDADVPPNGINDDLVDNGTGAPPPDGIADAEDNIPGAREEVADTSGVNCTAGRIYYIKHRLQQPLGIGDNDRFADHGESQYMALTLNSQLGFDLQDAVVSISTLDTTVCLLNDSVRIDLLAGNGALTETPLDPLNADPLRQGFYFSVPRDVRSVPLTNLQTVTFRIDVRGVNTQNLNEFSTAGDGVNSYMPQIAKLLLDVDEVATPADMNDSVLGRPVPPAGTWLETFEGGAGSGGFDHPEIPNRRAMVVRMLDATVDTRFGVDRNGGFCPECDVNSDCAVPAACAYYFKPDTGSGDGYPATLVSEWAQTQDWAKSGLGAYKFGRLGAPATETDQHYKQGQFTTLELPPIRLSNAATPIELRWWHAVNFWGPTFTSGLVTPVGAGVIEIASRVIGTDNFTNDANITTSYPISSFQRIYPSLESYDNETDALNACGTFFCRNKQPVFNTKGSFITAGTGTAAGTVGPATWVESVVDLSDYRGQEVVIRFTVSVIEDLSIQPGNFGWMIDDLSIKGVAQGPAAGPANTATSIRLQVADLPGNPCGLTAAFETTSPDCQGDWVQIFDRHDGLGSFTAGVPDPIQLRYDIAGGPTIGPGAPGALITPAPAGVDPTSTYDNPRVNFTQAGMAPGVYQVTQSIIQGTNTVTAVQSVVYKDAPVPAITLASAALVGGNTRFTSAVTVNPNIDPDRIFVSQWDFGDGSPIDTTGPNVGHVYAVAGNYTVVLTVVDEDGCSGSASLPVTVVPAPVFTAPVTNFVADCADPTTPVAITPDGNADINDFVTITVEFTNSGSAARDVVGYLTSPDNAVEVTRGVANFGNVAAGGVAVAQRYQFIRRPVVGETLGCLAIPFTLTLVSDGGTVVQPLAFAYTMGQATNVTFGPNNPPLASFCTGASLGSGTEYVELFTVPGGCLDGMRLNMTLRGLGQGFMDRLAVTITSPDLISHDVMYAGTGPHNRGPYTLDFYFGANNASGPVPNSNGGVLPQPNNLNDTIEATLISDFTGTAMGGNWIIQVYDTATGDCSSTFDVDITEFSLEGTNSTDLETAIELPGSCARCLVAAPPVFGGVRAECLGTSGKEGFILWTPATDASTCGSADSLTYEIFASTVPGVRGDSPTVLSGVQTCAANCPTGTCVYQRDGIATAWDVCNITDVYWTVVAVDETAPGARTPDLPLRSSAVPVGYQSTSTLCISLPRGGDLMVRKTAGGTTSDLEFMLVNDPNATDFRLLRGTFPVTPLTNNEAPLGTRIPWFNHAAMTPPGCAGVPIGAPSWNRIAGLGNYVDGKTSWYWISPSFNQVGCAGLGYEAMPGPTPGTLVNGAAHANDPACGTCNP